MTIVKTNPENSNRLTFGGMPQEDVIGIIVLLSLYTLQGVAQQFLMGTTSVILTEAGAPLKDLGILSLCFLPFSLKFLLAPILDAHYSKSFGKRKTYIIPMMYLYTVICIFFSFTMKDLIANMKITTLFVWSFIALIVMAIQDIAVDGWALTIVKKEYLAYAAATQNIGLMIGGIIAYNLYIQLNSLEFCNKYLYSVPAKEPILTESGFWYWNGIVSLIVTVCIQFFVKEKNPPSNDFASVWEVVKTLKLFYSNKNLRNLTLTLLLGGISRAPITTLSQTILLRKGFHRETMSWIGTLIIPFRLVITGFVGHYCKRKQEMKLKVYTYFAFFWNGLFLYWVVSNFDSETNYDTTIVLYGIAEAINTFIQVCQFVSNGSFWNRICDESVGGTFLTTLAALGNFGMSGPNTIALALSDYIGWKNVFIGCLIITPPHYFWQKRLLLPMESLSSKDFIQPDAKKD